MQRILLLTSFLFGAYLASGQFVIDRNVIYGGNATDEAEDIALGANNTVLFFGGRSFSTDGDVPGNAGGSDFWVMKRNIDGSLIWSKTFGAQSNDDLVSIMPHSDGGVLAFGTTHTNQGIFGTINGLSGGWLMRTNSSGSIINGVIFGGQITETAVDAVRAINGDVTMILAAGSTTLDGQTNHGLVDTWIVNVNNNFTILWSKLLGGSDSDIPVTIARDINSNIYVAAQTESDLAGLDPNHGGFDVWVMKLDATGQVLWQQTFGGSDDDIPTDILFHPDGFVYVTVQSLSDDDDFDANSGINDAWLLKLSSQSGDLLSKKRYGGSGNEFNSHLDVFGTDKLVISTSTTSSNGDITGNKGLSDVWIMNTDLDGNITQQMNYGGSVNDLAADILTLDTVFHVLNSSFSSDKNVPPNATSQQDFWYFTLNTHPDTCSEEFVCESDTIPSNIIYPPDNESLLCVGGCISGLGPGPDFLDSPCADFNTPTAYFKVVTDTMADLLTLSVSSIDFNKPRIAIFKSINCTTFQQILCNTGSAGSVALNYLEVEPRTTYVVAISDDEGNIGDFNFCASSIHVEFCNEGDRIYVTSTSKGSPPTGPFKPGEEVSFCYELYDWDKMLCNGIQGFVPTFGVGWDSLSFDIFGEPVQVDSMIEPIQTGFWDWYERGEVRYNISNPINGFESDQGMPPGWYFTNTGDPPPTDDPDDTTGDINNCLPTPSDKWKVCFTLRVVDDCETNLDCSVSIKTFADGEIGSPQNLACVYDQPEVFNGIMKCCLNPGINNIQDFSICSGDTVHFVPETNLVPPVNFTWMATPDPFVQGATNGFHQASFYQILKSNAVIPVKVRYSIRAEAGGCETGTDEFAVTILHNPTAQLTSTGPLTVCSGGTVHLNFQLVGDPPFSIGLYRDNAPFANILSETNSISIDIDPVFSSSLKIGSLEDAVCEGLGTGIVNVTVLPVLTTVIDTVICAGDSLIAGGTVFNEPGSYSVTLEGQGANGCDSMISISLSVIPSLNEQINEVICHGDSVVVLGVAYKETTNQIIEYQGPEGCTNFIHLILTVQDTFTDEIFQTICFGDTLDFGGIEVFQEGTYSHTVQVHPGCYARTILHLDVLAAIVINGLEIIPDNGLNIGAIILEISGGSSPYTFHWSTGQTTESLFNIGDGHYKLTVTDAINCTEVFEFNVPFVNATASVGPEASLKCYPTLLKNGDGIHLINAGKTDLWIQKLILTNINGQQVFNKQDIEIPGERNNTIQLPVSLSPGLYMLTARMKDGKAVQWKVVFE